MVPGTVYPLGNSSLQFVCISHLSYKTYICSSVSLVFPISFLSGFARPAPLYDRLSKNVKSSIVHACCKMNSHTPNNPSYAVGDQVPPDLISTPDTDDEEYDSCLSAAGPRTNNISSSCYQHETVAELSAY